MTMKDLKDRRLISRAEVEKWDGFLVGRVDRPGAGLLCATALLYHDVQANINEALTSSSNLCSCARAVAAGVRFSIEHKQPLSDTEKKVAADTIDAMIALIESLKTESIPHESAS